MGQARDGSFPGCPAIRGFEDATSCSCIDGLRGFGINRQSEDPFLS